MHITARIVRCPERARPNRSRCLDLVFEPVPESLRGGVHLHVSRAPTVKVHFGRVDHLRLVYKLVSYQEHGEERNREVCRDEGRRVQGGHERGESSKDDNDQAYGQTVVAQVRLERSLVGQGVSVDPASSDALVPSDGGEEDSRPAYHPAHGSHIGDCQAMSRERADEQGLTVTENLSGALVLARRQEAQQAERRTNQHADPRQPVTFSGLEEVSTQKARGVTP